MITGTTEEKISEISDVIKKTPFFQRVVGFFASLNRKTVIDIIIVFIPIALIYIYMMSVNPSEIRQTLKDNKKIEQKIDSIKENNQSVNQRMSSMEKNQVEFYDIIKKNNEAIQENNKELLILKRLYNAKINSVNSYNISQLDSFFTNRYKKYYR